AKLLKQIKEWSLQLQLPDIHGPDLPFIDRSKCCSRIPHCRHLLRARNQVGGELVVCGTNLRCSISPFVADLEPASKFHLV
ncbi:hypothetical protein Q5L94_14075, partial [Idiomarina sp. Sol25]|uniref:hypothetical protein n=1 Tax=Idiomarina sp. Sol25 TaxID=3064000 RepID=UPI00294B1175